MQVYCHNCHRYLDSKNDPEHWDEHGVCLDELETLYRNEAKWREIANECTWDIQAHWGDSINKAVKEHRTNTMKRSDHPDLGR